MPALAKILSEEEEEKLKLAQVEELSPQFLSDLGNSEELDNVIFRIFNPHAYAARQEYEEKKSKRMSGQKWLETIVNSQNAMRLTQDRIKQQLAAGKSSNNSGSFAGR